MVFTCTPTIYGMRMLGQNPSILITPALIKMYFLSLLKFLRPLTSFLKLFWDDDGKVYLSTTPRLANRPLESKKKDFAIHISEIDLSSGKTLTAPEVIRSSPHGIAEGSHVIKRNGYYYLFTAEGGTESGHQEWVLRSEKGPLGPWMLGPRNPLWYNGTNDEVQNTGHVDIFDDCEGNWWAVRAHS